MNIPNWLGDHFLTLFLVISIPVVLWSMYLNPKNWKSVPTNQVGVKIRFKKVLSRHEEGPVHVFPFERLNMLTKAYITLDIVLPGLPTAGLNTIDVVCRAYIVIRFTNPMRVLLSVVDKNPIDELKPLIKSAFAVAIKSRTWEEIQMDRGYQILVEVVEKALEAIPLIKDWGVTIDEVVIRDVNPPTSIMAAIEGKIVATIAAETEKAIATGQAAAWNIRKAAMGPETARDLELADRTVEASRFGMGETLTTVGETFLSSLFGGSRGSPTENTQLHEKNPPVYTRKKAGQGQPTRRVRGGRK
jgi:regulator of protease activity HflC (stomatin/prohibitin superfamily)